MQEKFSIAIAGRELTIETGRMAKQSDAAVLLTYGDSVVLVTAVMDKETSEDLDFMPLTIEYREKAYAAGKIPGGFLKRESRPMDREILSARLIDRSLRPLFHKYLRNEVQVVANVLSADNISQPDVIALIGASCAVGMSPIPMEKPVAAVRIGRIKGQLTVNPTNTQLDESDLDLVVAGTKDNIMMIEGGAKQVKEEEIIDALYFGYQEIIKIVELQESIISKFGKPKFQPVEIVIDEKLKQDVTQFSREELYSACTVKDKLDRERHISEITRKTIENFKTTYEDKEKEIKHVVEETVREIVRGNIMDKNIRADGRTFEQTRPISCEIGILPRTHGSALFTRGQTQSLAVATLGTTADEQKLDNIEGESYKSFMLHYNFPPFSVGEVSPIRGPGRREVGHGALAEKALVTVLPSKELFPYTIRIVSDILESNGSSSMASVCGGSLCLMDAGVPIESQVGGIAMGLVKEGERFAVVTDIMGLEDHHGDMDFKIAGTKNGITAIQLDIKINGINRKIVEKAVFQARDARLAIIDIMNAVIEKPKDELSTYAPRITILDIKPDKIRDLIGPGGKVIKGIIQQTGVKIDVDDVNNKVFVASTSEESRNQALEIIQGLIAEVEVGKIYKGRVTRVEAYGAFVEILGGQTGLIHISHLDETRVNKTTDVVNLGDEVFVKVTDIDDQGRINLSRKLALREIRTDKQ